MLTGMASAEFAYSPGEEVEVEDGLGARLCASGQAEKVAAPSGGRKPKGKQATATPRGEKR